MLHVLLGLDILAVVCMDYIFGIWISCCYSMVL